MDLPSLYLLLEGGATLVGSTLVKEATKTAFNAAKTKLTELLGRRASAPLTAIEKDPSDTAAKKELGENIATLKADELKEIAPLATALLQALNDDAEAKKALQSRSAIRLDVVAGGNVVIQRVEGASIIDVKADAKSDFIFTDVKMKGPPDEGN